MKKKKKMVDLSKILIIQLDLFDPTQNVIHKVIRMKNGKLRKRRVK